MLIDHASAGQHDPHVLATLVAGPSGLSGEMADTWVVGSDDARLAQSNEDIPR